MKGEYKSLGLRKKIGVKNIMIDTDIVFKQ